MGKLAWIIQLSSKQERDPALNTVEGKNQHPQLFFDPDMHTMTYVCLHIQTHMIRERERNCVECLPSTCETLVSIPVTMKKRENLGLHL